MLMSYKLGQGSIILRVKILDSAASTGAGKTGLTSASSGLIISTLADNESTPTVYTVAAGNVETITTLGTYAAPTSGKCRFKEVSANHPGLYEIHIADARYAVSSAKSLLISISGASGAAECDALIPLVRLDPYEAMRGTDGANTTTPDNTQGAAVITALGNGTVVLHEDYDPAKDAASQSQITGGGYSLDTDANGRIRVVDGTGVGEISLTSGLLDWNSAWDAEVQSEVSDALVAIGLDHLVSTSVAGTDVADNSIFAKLASSSYSADWDTFNNTTDSLQANRDWIGNGTNLTEAGGTGDHLTAVATPSQVVSAKDEILIAIAATGLANQTEHYLVTGVVGPTGNDTTHLHLQSLAYTEDQLKNYVLKFYDASTLLSHMRNIIAWDATNDLATLDEAIPTPQAGTDEYYIMPQRQISESVRGGINTGSGTITTLDALDTAQDTQHSATQSLINALNDLSTGDIDARLSAYDGPTNTEMLAAFAALNDVSQADITGYGGPLDTDAFGRIRSVDGTGTGEFDTLSGTVLLRAATEASIAATEADTNELQGDWMNGGRLDLLIDAINSQTGQMVFSVANKLDTNPTLTAAMCNKLADHSRRRTQANVFASSDGDSISKTSLYGFIQQAQYSNTTDNSGKLTIKNTDASELGQLTLATATADPVTGIGP